MTYLDSILLRAAQWFVDRVGGDYIGQRLARHLGIATYLSIIAGHLADYTQTGAWLTFICLIWALNIPAVHSNAKKTIEAMHRGFANPSREGLSSIRLLLVVCSVLLIILPSTTISQYLMDVCTPLHAVVYYLLATENPPPKKAKKTEETVALKPVFDSV